MSLPKKEAAPSGTLDQKIEMQIFDRIYDVTHFIRKHPGGGVIRYYAGQDATDAFQAFHQRSEKAEKFLRNIPSRPAADNPLLTDPKTAKMLEQFRQFRNELKDEGFFAPNLTHVVGRIIELVTFFVGAFYLLATGRWVLGSVLMGLAAGRCGWLQHEGGHGSLTGILRVDKAIQEVAICFGLVTCSRKWNQMHNRHHATPQKEDFDLDVDTLPFVAFYKRALTHGRRREYVWLEWIKWQHWLFFPVVSCINVFFWHFYLHPKEYLIRSFDPVPLLLILLRYAVHLYVCVPVYGWLGSIALLYFSFFWAGVYLFGNFSLNHTALPTSKSNEQKNWLEYGYVYTMNIECHWFVNWWMGYLNCQIEHHLFPSMPQHKQPQIVERVKKFCLSCDIPYQSTDYIRAVYLVWKNLKNVATYAGSLEEQSQQSL
eukprot:Platyproteum_vivax@DN5839_c0_g1_i1.p1